MRVRTLLPTLVLAATSGCGPRTADPVMFTPPRWTRDADLESKARRLESATLELINDEGLLLSRAHFPWGADDPGDRNHRRSHDLTDAPAVQGALMAALAFEMATIERDGGAPERVGLLNDTLRRLAEVYRRYDEVTGRRGRLGASMLAGYDGVEPLPWMATEDWPHPWIRSPHTGTWWRAGTDRRQIVLAVFGCSVPLSLERAGVLTLAPTTHDALVDAVVGIVGRVVDDGYVLTGPSAAAGPPVAITPDMTIFPNALDRSIALHLLASAAPYDEDIDEEYRRHVERWSSGIGWGMQLSGFGTSANLKKRPEAGPPPAQVQAFAIAACSVQMQIDRVDTRRDIRDGLRGWWGFVRHEGNALYATIYARFITRGRRRAGVMEDVLDVLIEFPPDKSLADHEAVVAASVTTPGVVQPLVNRPVAVDTWAANPFVRLESAPPRDPAHRAAAADYLLVYWMARYFELLPGGNSE